MHTASARSSLNNYDYAGQDPINNYDLAGTTFEEGGFEGGSAGGGTSDAGTGGDQAKLPDPGNPDVTFESDHAAMDRHGLSDWKASPEEVEKKIEQELNKTRFRGVRNPGDWLKNGRVTVNGQVFEFRAFRVTALQVNVGTYYLLK